MARKPPKPSTVKSGKGKKTVMKSRTSGGFMSPPANRVLGHKDSAAEAKVDKAEAAWLKKSGQEQKKGQKEVITAKKALEQAQEKAHAAEMLLIEAEVKALDTETQFYLQKSLGSLANSTEFKDKAEKYRHAMMLAKRDKQRMDNDKKALARRQSLRSMGAAFMSNPQAQAQARVSSNFASTAAPWPKDDDDAGAATTKKGNKKSDSNLTISSLPVRSSAQTWVLKGNRSLAVSLNNKSANVLLYENLQNIRDLLEDIKDGLVVDRNEQAINTKIKGGTSSGKKGAPGEGGGGGEEKGGLGDALKSLLTSPMGLGAMAFAAWKFSHRGHGGKKGAPGEGGGGGKPQSWWDTANSYAHGAWTGLKLAAKHPIATGVGGLIAWKFLGGRELFHVAKFATKLGWNITKFATKAVWNFGGKQTLKFLGRNALDLIKKAPSALEGLSRMVGQGVRIARGLGPSGAQLFNKGKTAFESLTKMVGKGVRLARGMKTGGKGGGPLTSIIAGAGESIADDFNGGREAWNKKMGWGDSSPLASAGADTARTAQHIGNASTLVLADEVGHVLGQGTTRIAHEDKDWLNQKFDDYLEAKSSIADSDMRMKDSMSNTQRMHAKSHPDEILLPNGIFVKKAEYAAFLQKFKTTNAAGLVGGFLDKANSMFGSSSASATAMPSSPSSSPVMNTGAKTGTASSASSTSASSTGGADDSMFTKVHDFIVKHESGKGGYEATSFGTVKGLTSMTIGEVLKLKGAKGLYQIMSPTLTGIMGQAGLSEADIFSPINQDKLGTILYNNRLKRALKHGSKGKNGATYAPGSKEAILEEFSHEWAAIPAPSMGGASYYSGVGNNKSFGGAPEMNRLLSAIGGYIGMTGSKASATARPQAGIPSATGSGSMPVTYQAPVRSNPQPVARRTGSPGSSTGGHTASGGSGPSLAGTAYIEDAGLQMLNLLLSKD